MIEVSDLEKQYGDVEAVGGIDFTVDSGEVFGLVGPNGAGKTSTLKMLSGLVDPSAGSVAVNGMDPSDPALRMDLGFLPEESPLYEDMTPLSYLRFFADLYDVPDDVADSRIETVLDRLDLEVRDRAVGDFSKGMKRKVAIARSLLNDPSVLVYDEPASGLDPITTNTVIEFTRELATQDKTIVFSAHDLYHVESVCDRVAIMHDGMIVAKGTIESIRERFGSVEYQVYTDVRVDGTRREGDVFVTTVDSMEAVESLRTKAHRAGGSVVDIRSTESSLEDVFLEVTERPQSA
ncbi:MAG: ATP-binding cassette domain-containing protein [Halodesulfurarchaeum sp.]